MSSSCNDGPAEAIAGGLGDVGVAALSVFSELLLVMLGVVAITIDGRRLLECSSLGEKMIGSPFAMGEPLLSNNDCN